MLSPEERTEMRKQDELKARRDAESRLEYANLSGFATGFCKGLSKALNRQGLPNGPIDVTRLLHRMMGRSVPDQLDSMEDCELHQLQTKLAMEWHDRRRRSDLPHRSLREHVNSPEERERYERTLEGRRKFDHWEQSQRERKSRFQRIQLLAEIAEQKLPSDDELFALSRAELLQRENKLRRRFKLTECDV